MENDEVMRLLLAAQVREVAVECRRRKGAVAFKANRTNPDMNFDSFMLRFAAENALTEFVPEAVQELRDIAAAISR